MEAIWTSNDPGEAFLWNLRVKRANELVQSQSMLATLRYDMELFRFYQKAYGAVFEQQGIDFFGEVYKASEPSLESKVETKVTTRPKVRPLTVTLEIDQWTILSTRLPCFAPPRLVAPPPPCSPISPTCGP